MKQRFYYSYYTVAVGNPMDRKDKIVIPDFDIELEYTDGGKYSSHAILGQIAKLKLEQTIWDYQNDGRELPASTEDEEFISKYHQTPMLLTIEIDDGKPEIDLGDDQYAFQ